MIASAFTLRALRGLFAGFAVLGAFALPHGALAHPLSEETLTCEVHSGRLDVTNHSDGGPIEWWGGEGLETLTAYGTCVVPGPDPSNPRVYDAQITDSGYINVVACPIFTTYATPREDYSWEIPWWAPNGSVSIQLYDPTGTLSSESATGYWRISWGSDLVPSVYGYDFTDGEGDSGGAASGGFSVRALDQVDCAHNFAFRRLTFDGTFSVDYESSA